MYNTHHLQTITAELSGGYISRTLAPRIRRCMFWLVRWLGEVITVNKCKKRNAQFAVVERNVDLYM